jgi:choline dehydrogenase-like flavoprotein
MHCVIGSGPAGVACAKALLARGANVVMLDGGLELEPERAQLVRRLAACQPAKWAAADRAILQGSLAASAAGLPSKLAFGSNYPYAETEEKIPWTGRGVGLSPSLALGGFSTVWGAAMLPYRDQDIPDWPVKNADLAQHYRAVLAFTGLAAQRDDLEELFPMHSENVQALPPSRQADLFLSNLQRHRAGLRERGWRFGRARVAVRAVNSSRGPGCNCCGLCMSGCPYGCIYSSADTVRELRKGKNFLYQRDVIVTKLREAAGKIFIEGFHRQTRAPLAFEADRAYLAAGVLPTAQILLRSQDAYDQVLRLRDSQYFLFPLALARRTPDVRREALYTLSQIFIELNQPEISRHTVHLQIYTYSDIIGAAARKTLGVLEFLAPHLEDRLFIVQGYLHSDESQQIEMKLLRDGAQDRLRVDAVPNPQTRRVVKKVMRELLEQAGKLGGIVLPPMLQFEKPGRGYHSGGSLPMRAQPGKFESDVLGRPHGWSNVHVVDASALPSIPATTITFSVMANAHRIGWETATG